MSQTVQIFVAAPLANGMVLGDDDLDPMQFEYVAIKHPLGETWFAGLVLGTYFSHYLGAMCYKVLTSVRFLVTPEDTSNFVDARVRAIPIEEFLRLQELEEFFWRDYWRRQEAGATHIQAILYAHAQVIADDR